MRGLSWQEFLLLPAYISTGINPLRHQTAVPKQMTLCSKWSATVQPKAKSAPVGLNVAPASGGKTPHLRPPSAAALQSAAASDLNAEHWTGPHPGPPVRPLPRLGVRFTFPHLLCHCFFGGILFLRHQKLLPAAGGGQTRGRRCTTLGAIVPVGEDPSAALIRSASVARIAPDLCGLLTAEISEAKWSRHHPEVRGHDSCGGEMS